MKTDEQRFQVGDVVTVYGGVGYRKQRTIRRVVRVLKRYVILSDGTKYTQSGYSYPMGESAHISSHINLATTADIEEHKKMLKWVSIERVFRTLKDRKGELDVGDLDSLLKTLNGILNRSNSCQR